MSKYQDSGVQGSTFRKSVLENHVLNPILLFFNVVINPFTGLSLEKLPGVNLFGFLARTSYHTMRFGQKIDA